MRGGGALVLRLTPAPAAGARPRVRGRLAWIPAASLRRALGVLAHRTNDLEKSQLGRGSHVDCWLVPVIRDFMAIFIEDTLRRNPRISLRTLLTATTLVAMGLGMIVASW